jgi:hypothetical protein
MVAATQSESDAPSLTKAASHAVFPSTTGVKEFLLASFHSPEFPCLTKPALSFPSIPQPII